MKINYPPKFNLANIPTPLQKIKYENRKFLIKRDDLTGSLLSGNKVRKLEYLLHEAKRKRTDYIFTCGGEQSNHSRSVVIAAKKLGFKVRLFLWGKDSQSAQGNLFLDKFFGAEISYLNKENYLEVNSIMQEEAEAFKKNGKKVYVIPEGGSNALGIWGYISFVDELRKQVDFKKNEGILSASGSGGTAAGLLVGVSLLKLPIKIYAVNVLYSKEVIRKKILNLAESCIREFNLSCTLTETNLEILDGYSKEGYKNIEKKKLKLIKNFAQASGILLDPAYTGKAFTAYYENFLMKKKGMKVIFIHTGGMFSVFAKNNKYLKV
ncbi:MAG: pyridoxal-phosphate dependent enzyme [Bacteroidetes bacterium]|nr:pyridoxal-phosphate dependent enzyme [Bacteroidota bacterium]